jgi:putative cardiolipin synthase
MSKQLAASWSAAVQQQIAAHPGLTGILPLPDAQEAFAARVLLMQQATQRIYLQYYIWRKDRTGTLLFEALLAAAERGVKVRLLLDDHNTAGLDATLIGLQQHPLIEVKLFNPLRLRRPRFINYLFDFRRVNRRMHNKAFIIDQQVVISGGRNIGDEYFGAKDDFLFADLDALMIGAVVPQVVTEFDTYWHSEHAQPLGKLFRLQIKPQQLQQLRQQAAAITGDPHAQQYVAAVRELPFMQRLQTQQLQFVWAKTELVVDHPDKIGGRAKRYQLITHQLQQAIGEPQHSLAIVSPYFVPTRAGVLALERFAADGVKIRILTNALESTDVAVVHAGYARWRKRLLRAGIELFELQKISSMARRLERKAKRNRLKGKDRFGSSASSLHAKTFATDQQRVFVGSFNFDPRSAQLNTELGFVIHSAELGQQISAAFQQHMPDYAYQVVLKNNRLQWHERLGQRHIVYHAEPGVSMWRRLTTRMLALLPIEWML